MNDTDWLTALAGFGLPGAPSVLASPPTPLGDLLGDIDRHKLIGTLAMAIGDEALTVDADDRDLVAARHEKAMGEVLLLEDVLLQASEALAAAGIDGRVLKGAALAHMVYPDPAARVFGDNDILVANTDVDAAVAVLAGAGATRPVPPISASFDRRFAKSVTLGWHGNTELDLHRTLAPGPYGHLIRLDDLFTDPVELILAGRVVHTLSAELHLLHGAIHVALGDVAPRLGNVRDLAMLAARPSVHVDRVIATAERWGCAAPLALGLRATRPLGHTRTAVERWADDHEISAVDRRRLEAYARRDGRFRRQAVASWQVLGWRDRIAFTRALLMPSAANRAARAGAPSTGVGPGGRRPPG
ncbi:MAG: nucleotidyltransferase family protein [Acidimicrobiales bacterium]